MARPQNRSLAGNILIEQAPSRFILAADCTVPNETPWDNLKLAIDTAHAYPLAAGALRAR